MKTTAEGEKRVKKMEQRLEAINAQMVDALDMICVLLRAARLLNLSLEVEKPIKGFKKRLSLLLDHLLALRREARELYDEREKILHQLGSFTPSFYDEFWQQLEGVIAI